MSLLDLDSKIDCSIDKIDKKDLLKLGFYELLWGIPMYKREEDGSLSVREYSQDIIDNHTMFEIDIFDTDDKIVGYFQYFPEKFNAYINMYEYNPKHKYPRQRITSVSNKVVIDMSGFDTLDAICIDAGDYSNLLLLMNNISTILSNHGYKTKKKLHIKIK